MKNIAILILLCCTALNGFCRDKVKGPSQTNIKGYYTRLPFKDNGFSGRFADIVIDLPQKGQFVFSRKYSYQPYWAPAGGKQHHVARLIERKGDGPDERPDKHNICSNASIVKKTENSITVHWRYAPDLTKESFTDFLSAYNKVGNPSSFYDEYTDEYFTVHSDGKVVRTVKKGCYKLKEWNDPENQITHFIQLNPDGIQQIPVKSNRGAMLQAILVAEEKIKTGRTKNLVHHWKFDEGAGQTTIEQVTSTKSPVQGSNAYWNCGVSGHSLSFDSYSNAVVLPGAKCPTLTGAVSISAWIAPQELPFNLAAIVDHRKENRGYFLGLNAKGRIVFKVGKGNSFQELTTDAIPLYEWTHVTAVHGNTMVIYIDGKPVTANEPVQGRLADAPGVELSIGMTRSFKQSPYFGERNCTRQFKSNMVFSGRIDEVKIFNDHLFERDVKAEYDALKPANKTPLKPWLLPAGPKKSPGFGAIYTKLLYSPEWDGLWRVGDYADILVTFEDKPWRYVFWRGTRYLPSLVTGYGPDAVWSNDQGPEDYYKGQCHEHMSDMLCRFSNARIIHNSEARTLVHWRNSSVSIDYKWPVVDEDGRGIWTDEYWTIYPDGISIRHQLVHNNTNRKITGELNQNEILHQPGQTTEDVVHDAAVIIASTDGETEIRHHSVPERRKLPKNWNLQYLNLKSKTKQFQIGEIGSRIHTILHSNTYWRGWNHYPVQLIPSDGTRIHAYDRPASTCPSTFYELQHKDGQNIEAIAFDYIKWEDKSNQQKVLVVSTSEATIKKRVSLLQEFGLKPVAIEVSPISLLNLDRFQKGLGGAKEVVMWLDIGAKESAQVIGRDGVLYFSRSLSLTSENMTRHIAQHCHIPEDEAEKNKKEYGLKFWSKEKEGVLLTEEEGILPADKPALVYNSLVSSLENLVVDIEHSFKSFSYQLTRSEINKFDRVVLCGGGGNLKNLANFLAERLGVKVELAHPFSLFKFSEKLLNQKIDMTALSAEFAASSSLAVGELVEEKQRINLLWQKAKKDILRLVKELKAKPVGMAAAAFILAFLLFILPLSRMKLSGRRMKIFERELKEAHSQLSDKQTGELKLAEKETILEEKNEELREKLKHLKEETFKPVEFSKILAQIAGLLPEEIWVTKLSYTDHQLNIAGSTLEPSLVMELIETLKASDNFFQTNFNYAQKEARSSIYNFEVNATVRFPEEGKEETGESG